MIFLETSFLIGLNVENDEHHKRANEIKSLLKNRELVISQMTIFETLTVLRKLNQSDEDVKKVYENLISIPTYNDVIFYQEALEDTLTNSIGFFDNLTHKVMTNIGVNEIASFDSDFDIFDDIKRIY